MRNYRAQLNFNKKGSDDMPVLTRAVLKPVKYFAEYYGIGKTRAYELINMEGFPKRKTGPRGTRVDMSKVDEWMQKQEVNF